MQFSKYSLIPSCETICNLLHSVKIDSKTCKLLNAQTYLKIFLRLLAAKYHIAELHISNRKKWAYKILKHARAIYANAKIIRLYFVVYITLQLLNAETLTQSQSQTNLKKVLTF
jgi:uncharacterized membrane protein YozB (DUF420 family)